MIVYLMYTFRDRYFPESVAIFECLGTDMLKSLFDDQFFESDAAEEGFTAYAFYTFSDRKLAPAQDLNTCDMTNPMLPGISNSRIEEHPQKARNSISSSPLPR